MALKTVIVHGSSKYLCTYNSSSGVGLAALGDRWGGSSRAALGADRHNRLILQRLVMIKMIKQ
jgi:hypothetical protein